MWMSLGKPSVEYAWDAIPNIQNRSKHLSFLPLLNLYQYLCWCLVLFNLFKFDLYCFKSLKGMFKKNRPHSSLLREANHPEHGGIIIY